MSSKNENEDENEEMIDGEELYKEIRNVVPVPVEGRPVISTLSVAAIIVTMSRRQVASVLGIEWERFNRASDASKAQSDPWTNEDPELRTLLENYVYILGCIGVTVLIPLYLKKKSTNREEFRNLIAEMRTGGDLPDIMHDMIDCAMADQMNIGQVAAGLMVLAGTRRDLKRAETMLGSSRCLMILPSVPNDNLRNRFKELATANGYVFVAEKDKIKYLLPEDYQDPDPGIFENSSLESVVDSYSENEN